MSTLRTSPDATWFHPRGALSRDGWQTVIDRSLAGLRHTGLRIGDFEATPELRLEPAALERVVVPLSGDVDILIDDQETQRLTGRVSVFDGRTDIAYLPVGSDVRLRGSGRVAVAEAPASMRHPFQVVRAAEIPVEVRGAGRSSRQVHNLWMPGVGAAERLLVCEVITPEGNWSSYPPHKHDASVPGIEAELEEIYYFEAAPARSEASAPADDGFGLFAAYAAAGDFSITELVRTGDVALVPSGYHGPAAAAPGYDLYYLNVMAGPGNAREWLATDDPAHAWIRAGWHGQEPDPRLPDPRSEERR